MGGKGKVLQITCKDFGEQFLEFGHFITRFIRFLPGYFRSAFHSRSFDV